MKKNIIYFTLSFMLIFSFFEILSRAIYPELSKNQIHKYVDEFNTISKRYLYIFVFVSVGLFFI